VLVAVLLGAATAAGWYLHARSQANPALTIAFLPGQDIAQGTPVRGAGPWTYGGQWMFNYTGVPITLDQVTLLGVTPGFHVTGISVALNRKQNGMVGVGFPPTWAPRARPVRGTVVPSLGLRQTANLNQTAEILIGFTLDHSKRLSGFRAMQIQYTQAGHTHTYILRAAFTACPQVPPATWNAVGNMCAARLIEPLS
jgi:hypothetical protein